MQLQATPAATTQAPAYSQDPAATPAQERATRAANVVRELADWGAVSPVYKEALDECAEEISFDFNLGAIPPQNSAPAGKKYGSKHILTYLLMWAELYPYLGRYLRNCAEEIETLAACHVSQSEKKACARDAVLEALTKGCATSLQVAECTGLHIRRVQRALVRLLQLRLVEDFGCGAASPEDGNRTRRYRLTHTRP